MKFDKKIQENLLDDDALMQSRMFDENQDEDESIRMKASTDHGKNMEIFIDTYGSSFGFPGLTTIDAKLNPQNSN